MTNISIFIVGRSTVIRRRQGWPFQPYRFIEFLFAHRNMSSFQDESEARDLNPKAIAQTSSSSGLSFITKIEPTDILCGRGHKIIRHPGNREFRYLVNARKAEYANSGDYKVKNQIARQIVDEIANRKGRFLRKVTSEDEACILGVPAGVEAWVIAEEVISLEKTKQALREKDPVKTVASREFGEDYPGEKLESDEATAPTMSHGQQLHSAMVSTQIREMVNLGLLQRAAAAGAANQQLTQPFENTIMNRQLHFQDQQRMVLHSILLKHRQNLHQLLPNNQEVLNPQQQRLMNPRQHQTVFGSLLNAAILQTTRTQSQTVSNLQNIIRLQRLESLASFDSLQQQEFHRDLDRQSLVDSLLSSLSSTLQHPTDTGFIARINQSNSSQQFIPSSLLPSIPYPQFSTQQMLDNSHSLNLAIDRSALMRVEGSSSESNALRTAGFSENSKRSADESKQEAKHNSPQTRDCRADGSESSVTPPLQKKPKRTAKKH